MKRLIITILLVLLAAPTVASSLTIRHLQTSQPYDRMTLVQYAQRAALRYWRSSPCGGAVRILYAPETASPVNDTAGVTTGKLWAWTQFDSPDGFTYGDPPSTYFDCSITINQTVWTPQHQYEDWPLFCATVVHEYGHLMGYPDSPDWPETSVLYPIITTLNMNIRSCWQQPIQDCCRIRMVDGWYVYGPAGDLDKHP